MSHRRHARLRSLGPAVRSLDTATARPAPKRADPFYLSPEWRSLVARLVRERGRRCEGPGCGRTHDAEGAPIRVFGDHVVELKDGGAPLDPANVRLLCGACHSAKTARARAARMAKVHRR